MVIMSAVMAVATLFHAGGHALIVRRTSMTSLNPVRQTPQL
jgi:hypothetical protein